ncbi:hypothetical protein [Lederbergia citrea]|uniref:hypothetical protein n=1 Tax=Lederbergia citrea TaxID=2833581 RepID=UPI001BCA1307|nr:hypothetical protein [Lederbergia citrea]MBS4203668.1 hypothetical protein [Lederbergia citrea]
MRELIIRFGKEGEYHRKLEEDRNYFLCEADEVVQKIKIHLEQEKRMVKQKSIELWMNGQKLLVTQMSFDKRLPLEKQLEEGLLKANGVQRKHVNIFKDYAKKERLLLLDREFKAFAIRFDQVLGYPDMKPFPLVLDLDKLKKLFDEVNAHIATGFYFELEGIITSIDLAYQTVVNQIRQNKPSVKEEEINKEVEMWCEEEECFSSFVLYAAASLQSVSKKRIDTLYPRFRPYQQLETFLFEELANKKGFSDAHALQAGLYNTFLNEYDKILFRGSVLKTDEMVESLVLAPVIQKYLDQVLGLINNNRKVIMDAEQGQVAISEH